MRTIVGLLAGAAALAVAVGASAAPVPDLQGIWNNATLTPFERPAAAKGKLVLAPAEAEAIVRENDAFAARARKPVDPKVKTEDLPHDCGPRLHRRQLRLRLHLD